MAVRQRLSMVQPSGECFWSGVGEGFVTVSIGHFWWQYQPRWQWVRLPARGFLLLFYSNNSPKMHSCCYGAWSRQTGRRTYRQTDKQKDGSQHRLTSLLLPKVIWEDRVATPHGRECSHLNRHSSGSSAPSGGVHHIMSRLWITNAPLKCNAFEVPLPKYKQV